MEQNDNRVDVYIECAADFAKPILVHLRKLVHSASAELRETIKWNCPFFDYRGPVCQMAAFKQHCAFGFWKAAVMDDPEKILNQQPDTAGSFGRITSVADLPEDEILMAYIRQAVALNQDGIIAPPRLKAKMNKADLLVPAYFTDLLDQHTEIKEQFHKFSASQQKEYVRWFEEAKTELTKNKRIETAMEWISQGKIRNWKYK